MTKATTAPTSEPSSEKDELEKIMSEIEELQHEMEVTSTVPQTAAGQAQTSEPKTEASIFPKLEATSDAGSDDFQATVRATMNASGQPVASVGSLASEINEVLTEASEEDILKEIQASAQIDDSDMESTLSQLKGEETGKGLLDQLAEETGQSVNQPVETSARSTPAVEAEMDGEVTDVLDAAIASVGGTMESVSGDTARDEELEAAVAAAQSATAASTGATRFDGGLSQAGGMSMGNQSSSGSNHGGNPDGSLTLTLTGNMTLKLRYEFEGQEVTVSFADQALRVQMTDGTEFKVPVARMATGGTSSNVKPFKKTG